MADRFSFEVVDATDYDELRPDYARDAVDLIVSRAALGPSSVVVDLAAGTGQLSRRLAAKGVDVIAVEPAANMRAVLKQRLGTVRTLGGTAEAIPLDDGVADAVVVGNAFHHFVREDAFAEIRRVLRSGGVLALFWAWPLENEHLLVPGVREIDEIVESTRGSNEIVTAYRSWREPPPAAEGFGPFERSEFPVTHVIPAARLADLYATSSDVASLPAEVRADLVDRIRRLANGLPETLHLPARTVVDLCVRSGPDRSQGDAVEARRSG